MSSSCRDTATAPRRFGAASGVTFLAAAWALPLPALAADTYWKPELEARVEGHTNRDLATGTEEDEMVGYFADLALLWGRATPRSETRIRPRVRFQDYPDRDDLQRLEQFLDVSSRYRTQRSELSLIGHYSRRDAYTAELVEAGFDEFDPEDPIVSETGRLLVDETRTRIQVRPGYTYQLSARTGLAAQVTAATTDYETQAQGDRVDFSYLELETGWVRELDERNGLRIGPYVSRYEADDDSAQTDAYGLMAEWTRRWTERTTSTVSVSGERNESDRVAPVVIEETDTSWGATVGIEHQTEVSMVRMKLGRTITPSGSGSKADADELRVEYDRAMSDRLSSRAAVRLLRLRSQSQFTRGNDRDYARAELGLQWAITPTWSIGGGYEFTWRDYKTEEDDANDSAVFLSLRFEGLGRQR